MNDTPETDVRLSTIADQLITELASRGIPADRYQVGPGSAGVNVWAPTSAITKDDPTLNRYPQTSVLISDSGNFHDIAWGTNYEHVMPLDTAASAIATEILRTLPPNIVAAAEEPRGQQP